MFEKCSPGSKHPGIFKIITQFNDRMESYNDQRSLTRDRKGIWIAEIEKSQRYFLLISLLHNRWSVPLLLNNAPCLLFQVLVGRDRTKTPFRCTPPRVAFVTVKIWPESIHFRPTPILAGIFSGKNNRMLKCKAKSKSGGEPSMSLIFTCRYTFQMISIQLID